MITAQFARDGARNVCGFTMQGHALLDQKGKDILCAAVSAMSLLVINTVTEVFRAEALLKTAEDGARIDFSIASVAEERKDAVYGVLYGFQIQLEDLEKQYPGHLRVIKNGTKG